MKIKKNNLLTVGLLALSFSLFSCSGDDGDIGPNGDKGDLGIQGEVGPSGADGSIIYSGEGEPLASTGIKGDYFFDVATGLLYGPKKETDKWDGADSFSLKGENGANGTDGQNGAKILSGTGEPSRDLGNVGDYYLNIETYILYGPRRVDYGFGSDTWGMGLELKGADGNANVRTFKFTVKDNDWTEYENRANVYYKYLSFHLGFSALTKDVYENGIIMVYNNNMNHLSQLPRTDVTSLKNIILHHCDIYPSGSIYKLGITQKLNCINNENELLITSDKTYHIKVITGQTAIQLKANRNNLQLYNKLIKSLE